MSLTSASEPPILATQIEVLENLEKTETIESYKPTRKEASVKRLHGNAATTSTVSESSDYSSSLLWTPAQPTLKQVKEKVGIKRSIFPPAQKRKEILSQALLRDWV